MKRTITVRKHKLKVLTICTLLISLSIILIVSCKKSPNNNTTTSFKLKYNDSIVYVLGEESDAQFVSPINTRAGIYTATPSDLAIDSTNGKIDIHNSESGLRYRIYYTSSDGTVKDSTTLMIAGINYKYGIYKINTADSIVNPIYNNLASNVIPNINNGTIFDEGSGCNSNFLVTNTSNGKLNFAKSVRDGFFGNNPSNGTNKTITLKYRIKDNSNLGYNKLKLKVFYFTRQSDITQQVLDLLNQQSQTESYFNREVSTLATSRTQQQGGKRRPPCLVVVTQ